MVLSRRQVEVFFEVVKARKSDCIAIQIVQPVHDPQCGHDPHVELADKFDFGRIGLLVRAGVVERLLGGGLFVIEHSELRLNVFGLVELDFSSRGLWVDLLVEFWDCHDSSGGTDKGRVNTSRARSRVGSQ